MHAKMIHLTSAFTLTDFKTRYGPRTVMLFTYRGGRLEVINGTGRLPEKDYSLIALVDDPDRPSEEHTLDSQEPEAGNS